MRWQLVTTAFAIIALAASLATSSFADEKGKTSEGDNPLVGVYKIVAGEKSGEKIPAEQLQDVTVRIAENALTTFDRDKKEVYAATYKLDKSATPWRITMTATLAPEANTGAVGEKKEDAKAMGLIESEGETVKLIYALPGGDAPKGFKTEDKQQMFELRKIDDPESK